MSNLLLQSSCRSTYQKKKNPVIEVIPIPHKRTLIMDVTLIYKIVPHEISSIK